MTAKIISICNQKGGCGKTTMTLQLAGALSIQKSNNKVLVVDADPQGSATRWASSAPEDNLFPCPVIGLSAAGGKIHQEIKKFISDFDWILIDCPPAVDSTIPQSALLISDLAIVPIIPSPLDLWAGVGIRELISSISTINEQLQARLVPNMCQLNTNLAKDAMDVLNDYDIPLAKTRLHLRTAYRQSAVFGGTVFDLGSPASQAIKEITNLKKEIVSLLKEPVQTTSTQQEEALQ